MFALIGDCDKRLGLELGFSILHKIRVRVRDHFREAPSRTSDKWPTVNGLSKVNDFETFLASIKIERKKRHVKCFALLRFCHAVANVEVFKRRLCRMGYFSVSSVVQY